MAPPHNKCECPKCKDYNASLESNSSTSKNEKSSRSFSETFEDFVKDMTNTVEEAKSYANFPKSNEVFKEITNKCYNRGKEFGETIRTWFANKQPDQENKEEGPSIPKTELNPVWYEKTKDHFDFENGYEKFLKELPPSRKAAPTLAEYVAARILSTSMGELIKTAKEWPPKKNDTTASNEDGLQSFVMVESTSGSDEWEMVGNSDNSQEASHSSPERRQFTPPPLGYLDTPEKKESPERPGLKRLLQARSLSEFDFEDQENQEIPRKVPKPN